MLQRRIPIDLSSLWENRENRFIIRYRDLNENLKNRLATRIKNIAPQGRIRNTQRGPTIQAIIDALIEINPIIFSEATPTDMWAAPNNYRSFNKNMAGTLTSWEFQTLCSCVYYLTCLKVPLDLHKIYLIARIGCSDRRRIDNLLNNYFSEIIEETESNPMRIDNDIGMDEIRIARQKAETEGANRMPAGMGEEKKKTGIDFIDEAQSDLELDQMTGRLPTGLGKIAAPEGLRTDMYKLYVGSMGGGGQVPNNSGVDINGNPTKKFIPLIVDEFEDIDDDDNDSSDEDND